jgi:hypothetical protein
MKSFLKASVVFLLLAVFLSGCRAVPPSSPAITSIAPDQGCPGDVVTITGSGFGDAQGRSKVTFASCTEGSQVEARVLSWSRTEIRVEVPYGVCSGKVTVTVNGAESNGVDFTVGDECPLLPAPTLTPAPTVTPAPEPTSSFPYIPPPTNVPPPEPIPTPNLPKL